jgi:hypothetical protein
MYEVDGHYFRMITPALVKSVGVAERVPAGDFDSFEPQDDEADRIPEGAQRIIEGPASTPSRDMQGEIVEPSGLDLSYFKRHGRINWDHGRNPRDIIGQPVRWRVTPDEFYLYALLYNGVEKADDSWKLFEAGATLAWSVEGKVLERAKGEPTRVVRAYVINVALTPNPVCQDTFASMAKSLDAAADELSKTLSTTSGGVLIPQSLEGDGKDRKPKTREEELFDRHFDKALGITDAACGCVSRNGEATLFVNGYRGAMSHFFNCCGATPEQASDLAGRHHEIARSTGRLLKGDA